jgi:hypothetical protein
MIHNIRSFIIAMVGGVLLASVFATSANATSLRIAPPPPQNVDLVIALDVSGSMSGLIDSAKQRLWDIVNELGRAQPQPKLRVAILSYGNPAYGAESGYVRIDRQFTSDLDAINATLFGFSTDGGDEYVARVVDTSINKLSWTTEPGALKILFVAGNEAATQDPQINVQSASNAAANLGIVVNTIYCGSEGDGYSAGWRDVAMATNGLYASIDQNAGAVANVATPMDDELVKLNQALNDTYIAYGSDGDRYRDNQREQDVNAGAMSASAAASRTVAKASPLYAATQWDLVDAVNSGAALEDIEVKDLPAPMQDMNDEERETYVSEQAKKREVLQAQIGELGKQRRDFIEKERAESAQSGEESLDDVMQRGLRTLAEKKGFTFER